MCAIAGIVGEGVLEGERLHDGELLVCRMLDSMKHRGPDHSDVRMVSDNAFLGHNRLSIIDLHPSSNQPFTSEDRRYTVVFNGEIYNYKELKSLLVNEFCFRTASDTEVLLACYIKWGKDCLERLIGMFAFAVWDNQEQCLFAARDRFGVKPFYFSDFPGHFSFASEIKALWASGIPRIRNKKVWSSFFVYGTYGLPHETFWNGIHQLPAGHFLIRRNGKNELQRWYNFEDRIRAIQPMWATAKEEKVREHYFEVLNESIRLRFRADVPVGFNVSGGLDSSLLLSLIKRWFPDNKSIRAYSFYTGCPDYDELPWVRALLETTLYPLCDVQMRPEDVPSMAEEMAVIQDEPYGGLPTLAYSRLFREARKQKTIVLLDGQGMDEAWAGYDYYRSGTGVVVQGVTGSPVRPDVLTEDFRNLSEKPQYPLPFEDALLNLQYRDLFYTKIPRALRFNDRASMMHSTELREPFLDHRLVEMAFALPFSLKVNGRVGKYLLRKITHELMPNSIRLAPKRPLQTPQREWLCGELRDWADEKIRAFGHSDGIDSKVLLREWRDYLKGGADNSFYIWQFINSTLIS